MAMTLRDFLDQQLRSGASLDDTIIEAKKAGISYHFTDIESMIKIVTGGTIVNGTICEVCDDTVSRNTQLKTTHIYEIRLLNNLSLDTTDVRVVIDDNTFNANNKININKHILEIGVKVTQGNEAKFNELVYFCIKDDISIVGYRKYTPYKPSRNLNL